MIIYGVPVYRKYGELQKNLRCVVQSAMRVDLVVVINNGTEDVDVDLDNIPYVVYNSHHKATGDRVNAGVSAAWNKIASLASNPDDIIIISNDDVTFDDIALAQLVSAASSHNCVAVSSGFQAGNGFSLFAFRKSVYDTVGAFDEGYYPAYFEDNDYHDRLRLKGMDIIPVPIYGAHIGSATIQTYTAIEWAHHHKSFEDNKDYYRRKKERQFVDPPLFGIFDFKEA